NAEQAGRDAVLDVLREAAAGVTLPAVTSGDGYRESLQGEALLFDSLVPAARKLKAELEEQAPTLKMRLAEVLSPLLEEVAKLDGALQTVNNLRVASSTVMSEKLEAARKA